MNMPRVKNEITIGSIASMIGSLGAIIGLIVAVVGFGVSIGNAQTDINQLKAASVQSVQDSRALIKLQSDMDYLKRAIDELRGRD
jgi:hypothetical protein